MSLPNLFEFATSELSQDAFVCWLLSWAKPEYAEANPALHRVGILFLGSIYSKATWQLPAQFSSVEIYRQRDRVDILCVVNNDTTILIEDKVGTKQHGNQLEENIERVLRRKFARDKIIPVYLQTGDQSDYTLVTEKGYTIYKRGDLLHVLEREGGKAAISASDVFRDYTSRLRQIEDAVQSYATLPFDKWRSESWRGFYMRLQQTFPKGRWDYVANASGGFMGFWWHWKSADGCAPYLQLEEGKLCFKIQAKDAANQRQLRDIWSKKISAECVKQNLTAAKPERFGNGEFMTVCRLEQDYRAVNSQQLLDFDGTCSMLIKAQSLLDACCPTMEQVQ
jgi:hypothetical protein